MELVRGVNITVMYVEYPSIPFITIKSTSSRLQARACTVSRLVHLQRYDDHHDPPVAGCECVLQS